MAAKLELYLDTSVISAYIDERDAVRQEMTRRFWLELPYYAGHICPIVLDEISKTLDAARREQMLALARSLIVLPWQEEMERLAEAYVAQGAFTPVLMQDARHVAAAVVNPTFALRIDKLPWRGREVGFDPQGLHYKRWSAVGHGFGCCVGKTAVPFRILGGG